ncbi:hypothetical protein FKP32DRAFT_1596893 [Trametes sanguinea]|nr:hypothetical protein FKP32DRAFT_1596893 [Trametes sanguinea]
MSHLTSDMEKLATQLTSELEGAVASGKSNDEILKILQRVKDEVVYTYAFSQTQSYQALQFATSTCAAGPGRADDDRFKALYMEISAARYTQTRDDDIRQTEALWWNTEPVPGDGERVELAFRDVTADYKEWTVTEVWPPETVEGSTSEAFDRVAQRFRVQANQKHRHPYLPSLQFDAILKSGRVPFSSLSERSVADVLSDLEEGRVVPVVRNDEENHAVHSRSPARYFDVWERTLPEWCRTPDHWIEPTPPPGFSEESVTPRPLREQYYVKVPTLHIAGKGRNIIPSATKPDIISRSLYIPVQNFSADRISFYPLQQEHDLVPSNAHLVPGQITLEAARALLGRVVQSSTEPRPDPDAERGAKRRKINKYASQSLGYAWGLETEDGKPAWLHCVHYGSRGGAEYMLDLSGLKRTYADWRSPVDIRTKPCAWLGAAMLPADTKAVKAGSGSRSQESLAELSAQAHPKDGVMSYDAWYERTRRWIRALNKKRNAPVVEVGPDGTFVGGDLGTSKGEADEFEAEITGAKPGVWQMSLEETPQQDRDGDGDEDEDEGSKTVRFVWIAEGTVDYNALPRRTNMQALTTDPNTDWEVVGSFSVDSGTICLFSKYALDAILATGTDREAMLEAFIDDDEGKNVYVPCGFVVSGNDGGYEIKGRRDADGKIVELKLRLS